MVGTHFVEGSTAGSYRVKMIKNIEIYQNLWPFSEFSDYANFDARIKINDSFVAGSHKSVSFSFEISITELKPVVLEDFEFEYPVETLLVAFLGFFGLSWF